MKIFNIKQADVFIKHGATPTGAGLGDKYNTHITSVGNCIRKKSKSSGKHPITEEPLRWMYYEEYIKLNNNIA